MANLPSMFTQLYSSMANLPSTFQSLFASVANLPSTFMQMFSSLGGLLGAGGGGIASSIAQLSAAVVTLTPAILANTIAHVAAMGAWIANTAATILNTAIMAVQAVGAAIGLSEGGVVPGYANGGVVYAARGVFAPRGTDTVPAMLTPGEAVLPKALTDHLLSAAANPPTAARMNYTPNVAPDNARGPRGFGSEDNGARPALHIEHHTHINALDSASFTDRIDEHKAHIAGAVWDAINRLGVGRY